MQIPQHLILSEPTLILCTNHMHATFSMADGDMLETLETMELEKEQFSDNESSNANPGTSQNHDENRQREFAKQLVKGLTLLLRDAGVDRMYIAAPADLLHVIQEELPADVKPCVKKTLAHDFMKMGMDHVLEQFHEVGEHIA